MNGRPLKNGYTFLRRLQVTISRTKEFFLTPWQNLMLYPMEYFVHLIGLSKHCIQSVFCAFARTERIS